MADVLVKSILENRNGQVLYNNKTMLHHELDWWDVLTLYMYVFCLRFCLCVFLFVFAFVFAFAFVFLFVFVCVFVWLLVKQPRTHTILDPVVALIWWIYFRCYFVQNWYRKLDCQIWLDYLSVCKGISEYGHSLASIVSGPCCMRSYSCIILKKIINIDVFNTLRPSDTQMRQQTNHHCLNQCLNVVNWTLRNKLQWNLNPNSYIFNQENAFKYIVGKMVAILSRPQCVNWVIRQNIAHSLRVTITTIGTGPPRAHPHGISPKLTFPQSAFLNIR